MRKEQSITNRGTAGSPAAVPRSGTEAGFSLVELVIALLVFSLIISAGFALYYGGQLSTVGASQSQRALALARDGLEGTRSIRDRNWDFLTIGNHGLVFTNGAWQFSGTSDTTEEFTRVITVSTVEDEVKKVTSVITWQDGTNNTKTIDLVETLSNWQGGELFGDWTRPRQLGSGDIGAGNEGTGIAYKNYRVYMTGSASSAAKPDFFVFDVSNPELPVLKSSLNIETGLSAVAVKDNYAYVVEKDNPDFFVIDISSDVNPVKIAKLTLRGNDGRSVAVYGSYAYVGTKRSATTKEFFVIDISNPVDPILMSSVDIDDDVNGISILGTTAYLATADNDGELVLYDVSNPANPIYISAYDAPGSSENGKSIHAKTAGLIYLGRTVGGNHSDHHEFHIVDASDQYLPTRLGSKDIPADINSLFTVQYLSFLATADPNNEFKVLHVADYSNILLHGSFNLPQVATGIAYHSNMVYLSTRSNDALKIITSTY